ncbi:uncharacterized protein LOC129282531 [Lytechinus pictus]|uniref:uncharacterized protein LOC129282531 n=1 Tax=Lytechinus pictus TaxID=7653 RepID=UPI0030BA0975
MTKSDVAYQAVGRGGDDSGGSTGGDAEEKNKPTLQHNENNHHRKEKQELSHSPRAKPKRCLESDDVIIEEEDDIDDELDSNNNDPPSTSSSKGRKGVIRRTMSFLVTLPRKLYSYVRGVFYTSQQPWSKVGHDHESEDSDWSSSEDGVTSRLNKARQERRSAGKSRDRHKPKPNKATPPPIAPKPKKRNNPSPSGSSNPPSSPDTTSPDTTPEISFDDIVVEPPQLKIYKRIQGPPGRRKPQRFSNQSDVRQSELQRESDLWR